MKYFVISIFIVLHFGVSAQPEQGLPLSTHYDMKLKEASSTWKIIEQPNGTLYIAAELLLAQYDGTKFSAIGNCQAASLAVDNDGIAYVGGGGEFGKIIIDSRGKQTYNRLSNLLTDSVKVGAVRYVWITSKNVYFCTVEAIHEYNKKTKSLRTYYPQPNGLFFNGFVMNDVFFISQRPIGLQKIVDGRLVTAPQGEKLKDRVNGSMDGDSGVKIFGYGRDGKMVKYYNDPQKAPLFFGLKDDRYLLGDVVYDCFPVDKNHFVAGTIGHGALLIDSFGNVANQYSDSTFFPDRRVVAVVLDRTQNLWLGYYGTQGKLSKTEAGLDMSIWNKDNGLTGSVVASIRSNGIRYVGTDNNLFYINHKNRAIPLLPRVCRFLQFVNFKTATGEKLLAITDTFQRLFEVDGTRVKEVFSGLEINAILQSTANPDRLYVSMRDTLLALRHQGDRFVKEGVVDISKGNYRQLMEDETGALWLLEYNNFGVTRMEFDKTKLTPTSITRFTAKDGLPDYFNVIASFDHKVILGSKRGLSWFNSKSRKFEPYRGLGKRFCNVAMEIQGLCQSRNGAVYVLPSFPSETNEIVRITFGPKGDTTYESRPFRRFPDFGFYSDLNMEDDVVWLSGTEGLIRYDPRNDTKNYDLDFPCLIRSIVSIKDTLLWGGLTVEETARQHAKLPYAKNAISFEFAAPFFDGETKTLYSVKLDGEDEQWSDWAKATVKNYDRLSEGTYTFRVKAKNRYGKESRVATYTFTIHPPWFRTWWAYSLYGFTLFLFVFGLVRWRTYSLNLRKRVLEKIVKEKTKELIESNKNLELSQEELRQNNDELLATNEHLKLTQQQLVATEKMASLGQLTAGIAHEINNPMNFISGGVQALQAIQSEFLTKVDAMSDEERNLKTTEIDALMKSVINGVKRTTNIIKSLRTFSSPVDAINENTQVDINECVETALVLMNNKLVDQHIRLDKNLGKIAAARANSSQLAQVVVNLVDNAVYAVKDNPEKIIRIDTNETDQQVTIRIVDNGTGIPTEAQKHLFEPFYTTKEVGTGTGLGLFICHTIIQRHNGKIEVKSAPGKGTEFVISLPKIRS
jgi:signal transduction histidine kinase